MALLSRGYPVLGQGGSVVIRAIHRRRRAVHSILAARASPALRCTFSWFERRAPSTWMSGVVLPYFLRQGTKRARDSGGGDQTLPRPSLFRTPATRQIPKKKRPALSLRRFFISSHLGVRVLIAGASEIRALAVQESSDK